MSDSAKQVVAPRGRHLAFLLDHLGGGGSQKFTLMLAGELARRGHRATLMVGDARGAFASHVPAGIRLVEIPRAGRVWARARALLADPRSFAHVLDSQTLELLPGLADALRDTVPDVLLTPGPYLHLEGALALRLAGVKTAHWMGEYNTLSESAVLANPLRRRLLLGVLRRGYAAATAVVAVSHGVADDLAALTGIPRSRITTIYPAVDRDIEGRAAEPVDHPWAADGGPPLVINIARLTRAKDLPTLIRAFARVRAARPARLVVFGDARRPKKTARRIAELRALSARLGVEEDVDLPGFVGNPLACMARSSVFALSSRTEGFGLVVAQALAVGCPVVSTDCPHGPAEILDGGRFGRLVPVGDADALGDAILAALEAPFDRDALKRRGASFTLEATVSGYEALLARSAN